MLLPYNHSYVDKWKPYDANKYIKCLQLCVASLVQTYAILAAFAPSFAPYNKILILERSKKLWWATNHTSRWWMRIVYARHFCLERVRGRAMRSLINMYTMDAKALTVRASHTQLNWHSVCRSWSRSILFLTHRSSETTVLAHDKYNIKRITLINDCSVISFTLLPYRHGTCKHSHLTAHPHAQHGHTRSCDGYAYFQRFSKLMNVPFRFSLEKWTFVNPHLKMIA